MLKTIKIGAVAFVGLVGAKTASLLPEDVLALIKPADAAVSDAATRPGVDVVWDGTGTMRRSLLSEPASPEAGPGDALPELLVAIATEHDALAARAAELDLREAEIELARSAVLAQNRQLETLREELSQLLEQAQDKNEADVTRLVNIYGAMKPGEAAAIMQQADLELAVLVISAMSERNSGPIMAEMAPNRANAISRVILERSRLPGDRMPVIVQLD
ncbi:MAG: MotE family protein [Pelagibaca sp.]